MTQFHDELKFKMDEYVHLVYRVTKRFPKEELYGVTSQLRRSALFSNLKLYRRVCQGKKQSLYKLFRNFIRIS